MKRWAFLLTFVFVASPFLSLEALTIQEKTASMQKYLGYFTFYWDEKEGKVWLEIDKFNQEFLYVSSLPAGLGSNEIGLDRNQLGRTRIVKFERVGPKVLLIQSNYSFRATSKNPYERKAVEDAFAKSVIWGFEIVAEEGSRVLVDASRFFLRDAHGAISALSRRNQGQYSVDSSRSAFYLPATKNFPLNTEIEAVLTLTSNNPGNFVRQVAVDPEAIMLRQHHSFIQLPDDGFKPRIYDPRSNFSEMSYMDFATPFDESIVKRVIQRHRLKKKDPTSKMSDPLQPIVYYVDPGAPEPIRSALIEGASWWNQAFEAIGYRNAFQVKVLPEGADPLDIRYNMINWLNRSSRGWSYGSSVTDPRTGEIIKGHVELGSLRIRQDYLIAQALIAIYEEGKSNSKEMREMALARIRQLSCHEVGHTLGLGHNFAASINDRASVMDYPHPLVKIKKDGTLDLSDAYTKGIGEWDKVSIAYGYQDFPEGVNEEKELRAILDGAFSRGLYFLSGQDAGPASAQPLAASWDNGKDPVEELERVMKIRDIALATFSEKRIRPWEPMATLEDVLVLAYFFHRYQVEAAASALGGLNYFHKLRGDVQKNPEIVQAEAQRHALDVLLKTIKPEFLAIDEKILKLLPPQPPGYEGPRELFSGYTGQTFDPLGAAEAAANLTIGLILNPARASRLVDHHARNNDYPGLAEVLDRLLLETWRSGAKASNSFHAEIQRVVNNVALMSLMGLAVNENVSPQVRTIAAFKLDELKSFLETKIAEEKNEDLKAHYFYGLSQIKLFQKDPKAFNLTPPLPLPPGAPIGIFDNN